MHVYAIENARSTRHETEEETMKGNFCSNHAIFRFTITTIKNIGDKTVFMYREETAWTSRNANRFTFYRSIVTSSFSLKKNHTFENFFIISYMQLVDKYFSYFSYCRIFFYKLLHCKIMRFTSVRNFIYHIRNSSKILYFPCSYLIQIKIFKNKTKTGKN